MKCNKVDPHFPAPQTNQQKHEKHMGAAGFLNCNFYWYGQMLDSQL